MSASLIFLKLSRNVIKAHISLNQLEQATNDILRSSLVGEKTMIIDSNKVGGRSLLRGRYAL